MRNCTAIMNEEKVQVKKKRN